MLEIVTVDDGYHRYEGKYTPSPNIDSVNYPPISELTSLLWSVNDCIGEIQDYGSKINKIEFPKIYTFEGAPITVVNEAEKEIYRSNGRSLNSVTGNGGVACELMCIYNSIYNTINELYNLDKNIKGFQFDYADFYLNTRDLKNDNYGYVAYSLVSNCLDRLNGEYRNNDDGSTTFFCQNGEEITIQNGKIVSLKTPSYRLEEEREYNDNKHTTYDYYDATVYFSNGLPYATELTDIHALIDFSDKDNITYSWVPRDDYKYLPSFKTEPVNTIMVDKNSNHWIIYEGDYLNFNISNIEINVPLEKYVAEGGVLTTKPFSNLDKVRYMDITTRYVNDIMDNFNNNTTPYFRETIIYTLATITLTYVDESAYNYIRTEPTIYCGYCMYNDSSTRNRNDIVMYTNKFVDGSSYRSDGYNFMVDAMHHEMGHAFANDSAFDGADMHDSLTWKSIFNDVSKNREEYEAILRPYSFKNRHELFADSVMYYYTDPEKLKMIEIDVDINDYLHYDNMYELMSYILNGGTI